MKKNRKFEQVPEMAAAAMKEAVAGVVATHKKLGLPLWVEQNGKVVAIPAGSARKRKRSMLRTAVKE
ncbi:MAG: hypothetical protein A2268_16820 [Candidatus Raymondbacteria bacterium RifOxyA12_full_50_37]|uniref:Uncharacterized protein n=1 Tax=Candidatus Raymondbacteria bacterium RIFOXYD12_FULL_49_13 TaxID=1817890 RepID=A0A1F7FCL1_UNCRA|nr:MAG: hypothetical protein A2268_16820 [Candidatus Raymondbacteria bacterium RifOxyA12_full_50_37]OGJ86273.1 MAG: hypothetical protein A2248_16415 [Candidatus Raymondbacteria bacterium RIFOXYA2_FULL_49_16]OGJ93623.1 MAG: hypothetical protein A2487_20195 [Candidatus Raymondbacteria bacterium RifOxyC12_full_50_8]OGJ95810.1 MAG: hypothetical protein A2453_11730 [Candidatus Raymondbacteria bacterium RIFOXYC2_FULL_50_21]OGJ99059.1 MAG: hypothetical protein A2350_17350 [Candidatus Raymondbacteria b